MKATLKAHTYVGLSLNRIRKQLTSHFAIDRDVQEVLRTYFTREWLSEYVRAQIHSGQIEHGGIWYNVIWYGVTPADKTAHKWFLSFRAPVLGIDCLPYVLITTKKDQK